MEYQLFSWRGKPIHDIRKWAAERGEKMVYYRRKETSPWGDIISYGSMPEFFWNTLPIYGGNQYTELYRAT